MSSLLDRVTALGGDSSHVVYSPDTRMFGRVEAKNKTVKRPLPSFEAQIIFNLEELWIYLLLASMHCDRYVNHYRFRPHDGDLSITRDLLTACTPVTAFRLQHIYLRLH